MKQVILNILEDSVKTKTEFIKSNLDLILECSDILTRCIISGHKILICGNGGSAADSQHIAAEFVNRFQIERRPLPALSLTTDTSVITSIGNDYSFDEIFSKQISALGQKDDVCIGISTSGSSKNVILAMQVAKEKGLFTIGFLGKDGGKLLSQVDLALCVKSNITARIQETHITLGHILCELIEKAIFCV